jgi:N6-L-threonylcarbamoyladenine synthase
MDELYLGIETSCDDTSCAIFSPARGVVVHRTAAQLDHERYGGVVPEIASRSHMRTLLPLYESVMADSNAALSALAGIGVTNGPGLTGSLLVGLSFAKALAYASGVPLAGIHHIEGHILANALEGPLELPALVLVVSGGHTQLVLMERVGRYEVVGSTRDDAAGEAFDKIGKLLDLPFPGGPAVERAAREGDATAYDFPRGLRRSGECDFSFSGLKTAVRLAVEALDELGPRVVADVAASAQEAIVEILVEKSLLGLERTGARRLYLAGGVAANGRLRAAIEQRLAGSSIPVSWPRPEYCTDNAAMIACAASFHIRAGRLDGLSLNSFPRGDVASWGP